MKRKMKSLSEIREKTSVRIKEIEKKFEGRKMPSTTKNLLNSLKGMRDSSRTFMGVLLP